MTTNLSNRERTIWRGSPALVFMLALVSISVFTWGLQYKLSLYKASERARPTIPAAKLLTPKQRPAVATRAIATPAKRRFPSSGSLPVVVLLSAALMSLLSVACILIWPGPRHLLPIQQLWCMGETYSRPPPAVL